MPGEMPPPIVMELWDNLMTAYSSVFGSKEYREGYEAAFDIFAEQLCVIGTVGLVPDLRIVKNNVGNATEEWFNGPGTAVTPRPRPRPRMDPGLLGLNRWGQYDWPSISRDSGLASSQILPKYARAGLRRRLSTEN